MGKIIKQTAAQTFEILAKLKRQYEVNPSPLLATTIENTERRAKSLLDDEMAAKAKNFLAKNEGSDWWELAKKQYPITQTNMGFEVKSEARDWEEEKVWTYTYHYEALEKVEQLVRWLHDGRVRKHHGSFDADVERLTAKYAT